MAFELQQLRQVIALVEHGSFVRAAAALHISQPALSRSIQNLERHFGRELFQRSSAGVVPTDVGRLYIERARDLLRLADDLDRDAGSHRALQGGSVAVGAGPFPFESFLGPAAARLTEHYPGISVQLRSRDWDDLVRELRSRQLDFFIAEASTLQREPDLEIAPLTSKHAIYLVARAGHPLTGRENLGIADTFDWPFAAPGRIPPRILDPMLAARRKAVQRGTAPRPFPSIQCNGLAPVKRIIATSDAISASILSCIAPEIESGEFVLLATEPWLHLSYGIVSLKGRRWTQAAEVFRQFVLEAEAAATLEEAQLVARYGKAPTRSARPRRLLAARRRQKKH